MHHSEHVTVMNRNSAGASEVYVFPDPDGSTKTTHYVICNINPETLPPALFGTEPQPASATLTAWAGAESGLDVSYSPVETLASKFNVAVLGDDCKLYSVLLPWTLTPGTLSVRAPPSSVFDVVGSGRKLLAIGTITAELILNQKWSPLHEVSAAAVLDYSAGSAITVTSVEPPVISAAMPQVCLMECKRKLNLLFLAYLCTASSTPASLRR
jgi:hypothetical protein